MAERVGSWNDCKHRIRSHVITEMLTMVLRPSLTSRAISMGGGEKEGGRKKGSDSVAFSFFPPLALQPVFISICVDFGKTLSFGILFMYDCNVPKCYNEGGNPTIQPSDFSFTTDNRTGKEMVIKM